MMYSDNCIPRLCQAAIVSGEQNENSITNVQSANGNIGMYLSEEFCTWVIISVNCLRIHSARLFCKFVPFLSDVFVDNGFDRCKWQIFQLSCLIVIHFERNWPAIMSSNIEFGTIINKHLNENPCSTNWYVQWSPVQWGPGAQRGPETFALKYLYHWELLNLFVFEDFFKS